MPEDRTYLIGLPVLVTVRDDGTVTYDVCTEDAGLEVSRNGDGPQAQRDAVLIEDDYSRRARLVMAAQKEART